uniref:FxLYD domain-containing protein n=1 Tax=Olsenella timonensis TaxID=1805478 RepID=UPI000B11DE01|nr:FxLYD domain-containing protein [Olsenella timonensis]
MAAKEGKRGVGKIVLIVVVALVVIGAIGSMGGNGGANQAPAGDETQTSEQQPAEQTEPYTISDEQLDTSNGFAVYINGTLTNNTENEVSYIQVEYNLYDADGAQVGTALANTNNLKAGGT